MKIRQEKCVAAEIHKNLIEAMQYLWNRCLAEKLGHQPWNALRVIVEENRAEVNFELVERLAEREERDWTYFGRLPPRAGEEASKSARCADRGRPPGTAAEEAPGHSDAELRHDSSPLAAALPSRTQRLAATLIWNRAKNRRWLRAGGECRARGRVARSSPTIQGVS